ncbi:nitrile hydratase subunit alpha [Chelatococcus sambhunathii]|uniref:nitrile hydratase n=1 Tax=Chelatococcus sambhunathii TaxID=363953 RepID=A0ABU1DEU3_9HYPH|nr:nitrile hydratase subunit alpha [Chelatococcus sambhunathii]MDR4306602.1 nitrile hydratase subunit alpha [Chelatococcus sambhunathii]
MSDDHEHEHHHHLRESETYYAARTKALESLFREKGLIGTDTVDRVINFFEHEMGPFNGAKVVAKAWTDPAFKARLLADANKAIAELGMRDGIEGENLKVVENVPGTHNVVCCTLCSCWPWPLLGLPPYWFKDPVFRARVVREPRGVLSDFGVTLPDESKIEIWDSSAQVRYFVIPERPTGTEGWTEEKLAALVSTEAMQGLGLATA